MIVGVPKEVKDNEYRVAITPEGVREMTAAGHRVVVETNAGAGSALADERFVAAAHARGLQVHVWTVDSPEECTRMLDLGVDGVMPDRPAMLKQLLERRGQWRPQ